MKLEEYLDATLVLNEGTTKETLETRHIERLLGLHWQAEAAQQIPRRLGPDATRRQLATDKKLSRSVAAFTRQAARYWFEGQAEGAPKVEGAGRFAVDGRRLWGSIAQDQLAHLVAAKIEVSTFALRRSEISWGSKALSLLETESENWRRVQKRAQVDGGI